MSPRAYPDPADWWDERMAMRRDWDDDQPSPDDEDDHDDLDHVLDLDREARAEQQGYTP